MERLMHHRGANYPKGSTFAQSVMGVRKVVFKEAAGKGLATEVASLYPAFGFAVLYKMLQRSLQFGMHPVVSEHLRRNYGHYFHSTFGDKWHKTMIAATGGIVIGIGEVVLLPLDALKVKGQTGVKMISRTQLPYVSATATTPNVNISAVPVTSTNLSSPLEIPSSHPRSFHTTSFASAATVSASATALASPLSSIPKSQTNPPANAKPPPQPTFTHPTPERQPSVLRELIRRPAMLANLYRGATWTAARNACGCFALFGCSVLVKDRVFQLEDHRRATFFQTFVASVAGACASIAIAAPLDVIKVRVQAAPLDAPIKGITVVRAMLATEGLWAFGKGVIPKMLASAPKVTFSFTIASYISNWFAQNLHV